MIDSFVFKLCSYFFGHDDTQDRMELFDTTVVMLEGFVSRREFGSLIAC